MKAFLYFLLFQVLLIAKVAHSTGSPNSLGNKQIQQHPENSVTFFMENKGQITNAAGGPVPFVLYESSFPGMKIYITEKGLTYVFTKIEDNVRAGNKSAERNFVKEETLKSFATETAWINMSLQGAF